MYWLIFIFIIISSYLFYLYDKEKNKNLEIDKINKEIKRENENIYKENENLLEKQKLINNFYEQKQKELNEIQKSIEESEQISKRAFEKYIDSLDREYDLKEKEYQESIDLLNNSYGIIQNRINAEIDQIQMDLDKISATRTAAIQAQLKEEEIKQKSEFYSLSIDDIDKREIKVLQSIEKELRNPRPVRMIIWQTYYSKKANELCSRVLGTEKICGIYKITNKNNNMCYIGQTTDMKTRWRDHMKCGLGIDVPANNKLYKAMMESSIEDFTFEVIEKCPSNQLNEKEFFYISLYDSYNFGYNSNSGIKNN